MEEVPGCCDKTLLNPRDLSNGGEKAEDTKEASNTDLPSPGMSIEIEGAPNTSPRLPPQLPAPVDRGFKSPIRQHVRTPSMHREVKETLNARSEYMSDDLNGRSRHRINQYVIKEEIGRGSFGAVHLATDQFGNEYAVKEFSKARLRKRAQSNIFRAGNRRAGRFPRRGFGAHDKPEMDMFSSSHHEAGDALFLIREEIAIMKKLNHPNLVQLIEVLDDPEEDSLYMVLEMCKKGVIMKVGLDEMADPYSEESCRCWFRDLILGIEYLHYHGVVHRDIKPDNLLVTDDDVLKVVDFGVSEMFEKASEMKTAKSAGSPAFLPPELCVARHGDISGKAADIWSMGVSLFCLRYGRIPFEREGVFEMYEAIKNELPRLPNDENPLFVDLMRRLTEKDPGKRITMGDLREHPWVTKNGEDPLLSVEENCAEPIELPTALELNHAFTRRMSHLLCVMKSISKFKGLLGPPGVKAVPPLGPTHNAEGEAEPELAASRKTAPKHFSEEETSAAEHAARVLQERERFRKSAENKESTNWFSSGRNQALNSTGTEPPVFGIGVGGLGDFLQPGIRNDAAEVGLPAAQTKVVSDSPTAVDFNVYDRAFEQEMERIKQSSSRQKREGAVKRKGSGMLYRTRHLDGKAVDILGGGPVCMGEQGHNGVHPMPRRALKLEDLVAQTMKADRADAEENQGGGEVI